MNAFRSVRVGTAAAALVLTLGLTGLVSAQSVPHSAPNRQATAAATAAITATPIDVSIPVPLTVGTEAQSPLDNDAIYARTFKFRGTANQLMNVTTRIISGNMSVMVQVFDQAGAEIANVQGKFITISQITVKLPQDGNYTVQVAHQDPGSGDFEAGVIGVTVAPATMGDAASGPK